MKLDKLKAGDVVYEVGRQKMGSTTLSTVAVWAVNVISVDLATRTVCASWNGNKARTYYEHQVKKWRAKKPITIGTLMGGRRLATRDEIAKFKAEAR